MMNSTEAWYQINLECKHHCDQLRESITHRQAERASVEAHYSKQLEALDKIVLQKMACTHGRIGKEMARSNKVALLAWLVQIKLEGIDLRIAELQRQIEEQSSSPYWREEKQP